jgi:methionyl aminopeptidase
MFRLGKPASEDSLRRHTIVINTPEEIEGVRVACKVRICHSGCLNVTVAQIGREVLDAAGAAVKVGMTTDEIDKIVHEATIARNAYPLLTPFMTEI